MFSIRKLLITALIGCSGFAVAETDPTRPLTGFTAPESVNSEVKTMALQSIITLGDNNRRAIISGIQLKQGDQIKEYRVVKITGNSVVLKSPEQVKKLTLLSQSIVHKK